MSSKLVKKGLDFMLSLDKPKKTLKTKSKSKKSSKKHEQKRKDKVSRGSRTLSDVFSATHAKKKKKDEDFTEQNLKYFLASAWEIKRETKDKIVQHKDKQPKEIRNQDEADGDFDF
ncbi:uncharacterized protein LOC116607027 [Nematostella vectensis]|uniref:uncharacterized protein LOC116607027 n=1 Tax=Nematostella vectensis TaxID=45351 RepID=UPI0020774468|nr:uncharacterized protein LOC116607027 [Nematostella vectensis]